MVSTAVGNDGCVHSVSVSPAADSDTLRVCGLRAHVELYFKPTTSGELVYFCVCKCDYRTKVTCLTILPLLSF